jgi:hypothetical protein
MKGEEGSDGFHDMGRFGDNPIYGTDTYATNERNFVGWETDGVPVALGGVGSKVGELGDRQQLVIA